MPQCSFVTGDSQPCRHPANPGNLPRHLHVCTVHSRVYQRAVTNHDYHHRVDQCVFKANGPRHPRGWCEETRLDGTPYCERHTQYHLTRRAQVQAHRDRVAQQDVVVAAMLDEFLARNPLPPWQEVVREVNEILVNVAPERTRYRAALQYYTHVIRDHDTLLFNIEWNRARVGGIPPVNVQPQDRTLRALALDGQNVHTRHVVEQTREIEALLLAVPIPATQQTETIIAKMWLRLPPPCQKWSRMLETLNDIHKWFNQTDCRATGDSLYRRMLRGTVAKINRTEDEIKNELYLRLWQECHESVGMCCEGHLSRLGNVFVGFDDAFRPPVAFGEILQQTMSAIAALEIADEEKRERATAWFVEHAVPEAERAAWLEAF
jgi:hypothetical protein